MRNVKRKTNEGVFQVRWSEWMTPFSVCVRFTELFIRGLANLLSSTLVGREGVPLLGLANLTGLFWDAYFRFWRRAGPCSLHLRPWALLNLRVVQVMRGVYAGITEDTQNNLRCFPFDCFRSVNRHLDRTLLFTSFLLGLMSCLVSFNWYIYSSQPDFFCIFLHPEILLHSFPLDSQSFQSQYFRSFTLY